MARGNPGDPLWVCVILDPNGPGGKTLRVFQATTESGLDAKVGNNEYAMANSSTFTLRGGRIGFCSESGQVFVDDLAVHAWDEDLDDWKTQFVESFDTDGGNYVTHELTHDPAGNLTFDGLYAYTYDAWNRLL